MKWTAIKKDFELSVDALDLIHKKAESFEIMKTMLGEQVGRLRALVNHFPKGGNDGNTSTDISADKLR